MTHHPADNSGEAYGVPGPMDPYGQPRPQPQSQSQQPIGYPPYGAPAGGYYAQPPVREQGFFRTLIDPSFNTFISVKFARIIYLLALVMAGATVFFGWIAPSFLFLFGAFFGPGFLWVLFGWIPVGLLAISQLIGVRLFLEFVVGVVKTAENTSMLATSVQR